MFPANGPTFLVFYVILIALAGLTYWCLRAYLVAKANRRSDFLLLDGNLPLTFTPQLAGYLLDGPGRAAAARVLQAVERSSEPRLDDATADAQLAEHGFILSRAARATLSLWAIAMFGGLFAAGLVRFIIGAAHARPVGYLLFLVILVAFALYRAARHRLLRTRAGDRLVAELRHRHRRDGQASFAMGFALLGWAALEDRADLQAHLHQAGYSPRVTASGESCIGICAVTSAWGCFGGGGGSGCASGCGGGGCGGCS